MQIQPTQPINFGYSHELKTLYKKGKLPSVEYGFYGDKLTPKNVTIEHLLCVCKGGITELKNIVLATCFNNSERGNQPLFKVINIEAMYKYLEQFKNIKLPDFDGNEYIKLILKTVNELLRSKE